jgi:hypothetical protein
MAEFGRNEGPSKNDLVELFYHAKHNIIQEWVKLRRDASHPDSADEAVNGKMAVRCDLPDLGKIRRCGRLGESWEESNLCPLA